MNITLLCRFGVLGALLLLVAPSIRAQSFSLGTDVVSRYVWRGADFGESASLQPVLAFSAGGLEVGTWASYSISADGAGANEHDLWVGYTIEAGASGSFSFGVTDYYFPAPEGSDFFNFDADGTGSHFVEPYVSYTGPAAFPITLFGSIFAYNDPDHSLYLEANYPFQVDGVELGLTAGAVGGQSALYGTTGFAVVNLGLSATKSLPVSDQFDLPIRVAYILNPDTERSFLIFGLGISL